MSRTISRRSFMTATAVAGAATIVLGDVERVRLKDGAARLSVADPRLLEALPRDVRDETEAVQLRALLDFSKAALESWVPSGPHRPRFAWSRFLGSRGPPLNSPPKRPWL